MVRMAAEKGTRTLILTDRIELFEQTFKAIQRHNIPIQIVNANTASIDKRAVVTVAMIETLHRRGYNVEPDLIIIDEAHKGNFTKLIDTHPTARVIGATATPVGKHIPKYYSEIIQTIDTPDLVNQGYLCECKAFQMVDDFSDLTIKGKEYTDESLFNHFNKRKLYSGVVTEWQKRTPNKKTIVFNVNIEHSDAMAAEFNATGIVSESITSKTPKAERERILQAFSKGLFPVLNNCGILTTGYDEPSIECVIMNRKTLSLPLFLQCLGRGSRPYTNKTHFTVLDFGMNHDQHGMWNEPREWSLKEKKKKKEGAAPVKTCPKCEAMLYATAKICKFCNHVFEVEAKQAVEGVMIEVIPRKFIGKKITELSLVELIELQKTKKYKASYIWRVVRSKGEEILKEYAGLMAYKSGWITKQVELISDSKFNDYAIRG
jgi:superfamily II DNA or RNA helicase